MNFALLLMVLPVEIFVVLTQGEVDSIHPVLGLPMHKLSCVMSYPPVRSLKANDPRE